MPSATAQDARAPIAIIGMSCRFPGDAEDPLKFWDLLKEGREAYSEKTHRYNEEAFYHPGGQFNNKRQNVLPVKGGYMLKQDPYVFDAAFFNITAAEAISFDPKQRIAMEVTYEAFENAGMTLQKAAGTRTACYIGTSMSDYRDSIVRDFGNYPKYHLLGTSDEMISNRISHFFDLRGPSATIETACSSSHVATHIACQSIQSGESDMAVVGGIGMLLVPESTMQLNNLGFLSAFGQSRAFDASGAGYGRGEGCGIFILKRLDKAMEDGDTIRAIIRGSGVNSDGWTQGVTMPSGDAQASLIEYVYKSNGLDYEGTQYVEAHGTGTKVGDPTEAEALHRTIGQPTPKRKKLWMGSVKTNIGHLEAAAGAASMVKGVLAMEHGFIPPTLHFKNPNPAIKFDEWQLGVPTKLMPWPACQTRRMSTSAFGMGGTNAHLVLERPNEPAIPILERGAIGVSRKNQKRLFVFSSHDQAGFKRICDRLVEHVDTLGPKSSNPDYLANLAHTLAVGRSGLTWKSSCFAENIVELREHLTSSSLPEGAVRAAGGQTRIGFVFTGQGAQWARMGVELMDRKVFGKSVAKSTALLQEMGCEWDPVVELSKSQKESQLVKPEISQPICTILQIALIDELRSWGIRPAKVVGHSSGEIAAAYCMGALTHRDALAAAYFRGKASANVKRRGGMMAVGTTPEDAKKLITETKAQATVACVNSPRSITLSGDVDALEALRETFEKQGVFARRLKVDVAYHSSHMRSCSAEYQSSIMDLEPSELDGANESKEPILMVSSVTGGLVDAEALGPYYWIRNLISPVLFSDALKELVCPADSGGSSDVDMLIEIGPHSALRAPIEQILSHHDIKNVEYASMLTRGESGSETILGFAAELFRRGVPFDIAKANDDAQCRLLTDLPPYPFNHSQQFRAESRLQRETLTQQNPTKSLIGAERPSLDEHERVWRGFINLDDEPWLRDHTVGSTVLFPGAAVITIVLEAAQQMAEAGKTIRSLTLRDISFMAMMTLLEGTPTEVITHVRPHLVATTGTTPATWWEFTVSSCTGVTSNVRNNCRGLFSINYEDSRSSHMEMELERFEGDRVATYHQIKKECVEVISKQAFYDTLARSALAYGPHFQGVDNCRPGNGQTAFEVIVSDLGETFNKDKLTRPFLIHGGTLDSIFQAWVGSTKDSNGPGSFGFEKPLLPKSIGELEISLDFPGEVGYSLNGLSTSKKHGFSEWSTDITMFDRNVSKLLLSVKDFHLAELEVEDADRPDRTEHVDVDPAEISSEPKWNYALDFMSTQEIKQVVETASSSDDKLMQFISLAIHQRPNLEILELVESANQLRQTAVSKLPRGRLLPNQASCAILGGDYDNNNESAAAFGRIFGLDSSEAVPSDVAPADLVIANFNISNLEDIAERLVVLAKPEARILLIADKKVDSSVTSLADKGFDLVFSTEADSESLSLYCFGKKEEPQPERLTNGSTGQEVVILEPSSLSAESDRFSKDLQHALDNIGYNVSTVTDIHGAHAAKARIYVSLLEIEQPVLENLSQSEFEGLRDLLLNCDRLLWITRGDGPSLQLVDGFSRTIRSEFAGVEFQVLHLSGKNSRQGPSLAAQIVFKQSTESEFREDDGHLQISRWYRSVEEDDHIRNHLLDSIRTVSLPVGGNIEDNSSYRLAVGKPGLLNTLHFVSDDNTEAPLADNEVEMQVKASGINFRDIMGSMGLLPVSGIGQEASGIVVRVGKLGASSLKPGDRISTLTVGGTHATRIRCDYRVAKKIPEGMSFEEAAGIPVVHCTAYYALVKLAKLRPGQSVLIHAAAGGTGQAALQLAKHLGLTIFATVGTDTKRALIREKYGVPDENIFHSRDGSFVKGIERATNGRGVDCVLNSLSGELLRLSWGCLATFGTFVEIGLRDITDNMRLDMRPFAKSTTFSFINMVTLLQENPDAMGEILESVFEMIHQNVLQPVFPVTVYPVGKVEEAFRLMQQGKHVGKMILSFAAGDARAPVLCRAKDSFKLDPNATYLFIGGLGGLGRSMAVGFVACGARNIAFLSRSGDSKPEAKAVVDELRELGTRVQVYLGDVSDEASFRGAMEQCSRELPPVKGVIQMAMVLRDVVFEKMKYDDWTTGLRPKVQGTWNLHTFFDKDRPLDFMIFFSSIAGVFGNPSQAQYAAGNTYQDSLAKYRRDRGLKAVSVNLGIMRDVGVIAEGDSHFMQQWEEVLGIREPAFHALIKSIINGQLETSNIREAAKCPVQVTVGLGTGDILARNKIREPDYFRDPRFGALAVCSSTSTAAASSGENGVSIASQLAGLSNEADPEEAAGPIITKALVSKLAKILQVPPSEIDSSRPMYRYGVDSLVAIEVRNWITKEMSANMSLMDILGAMPMEQFAVQIAKKSKLVGGS
uniref:Reducing polyketide synthase rdc5 n=1 Tax=Metacordyceps chlamydosporia TaxID=280754 RepID=RDC5_METCM|nr:RecName: Full=Reducing polyketide synthase rdc5; Short=R-PKS rdc5; AltName: Full=Hypothemycin biosynthesis cluster protein rdc5 [Pochonia chlamydosporia]ACD39774.1 reducing polyketide synthase [Pochonia chlamydosporia]